MNLIIGGQQTEPTNWIKSQNGVHEAVPTKVRGGVWLDANDRPRVVGMDSHLAIRVQPFVADSE